MKYFALYIAALAITTWWLVWPYWALMGEVRF